MARVAIIGGGASGYFTAINWAGKHPSDEVIIIEKAKNVLQKVKISGGGRCNVTHYSFIPRELTKNYPRGEKELLSSFNKFNPGDTIGWFAERGVELVVEDDNRMFPESNTSQTIIDCFLEEAEKHNVKLWNLNGVNDIREADGQWLISLENEQQHQFDKVCICTGSNLNMWKVLERLGHKIVKPVPSLFTFKIKDERIKELPGIAVDVDVRVENTKIKAFGPLLITHRGVSGPAILRLSAWGARDLFKMNYQFEIVVNWATESFELVREQLLQLKEETPKKKVLENPSYDLPKRLWKSLGVAAGIQEGTNWAEVNKKQLQEFALQLSHCKFQVNGKNTFKDEFVTAGGVDLKEVNFKTMESKLFPNLFFAGEVLNIDAITGGFNFQAAWSTSWIVTEN